MKREYGAAFCPSLCLSAVFSTCRRHGTIAPRASLSAPLTCISRRRLLLSFAAASPTLRAAIAEDAEAAAIEFERLSSGLVVQDLRIGRGPIPVDGNEVSLRWTGRLAGRFGWPFQREDAAESRFTLGRDTLIAGFEEGLRGMHEGGKRRMLIPPELGYVSGRENPRPAAFGDRRRLESTVANARRIAGAGTVVIDVELLKVRAPRPK